MSLCSSSAPGRTGQGQGRRIAQHLQDLRRWLAQAWRQPRPSHGSPPQTAIGERVYAIGDIHGRLDLFGRLVAAIEADSAGRHAARIRLIVLGDFVDRGPDSAQLAAMLMRLDREGSVTVLKGNHEDMLVAVLDGDDAALDPWLRHGGRATLASWGVDEGLAEPFRERELVDALRDAIGPATRRWLSALPLHARSGDYLFVHAGIRPGVPLSKQEPRDLMWIRRAFLDHPGAHEFMVVHGHSVVEDGPHHHRNRIAVDTGAYRTGRLCAVGLEGGDRWDVCVSAPEPLSPYST